MVDQRTTSPTNCANCGTILADRYCPHCGQDAHVTLSLLYFVIASFVATPHARVIGPTGQEINTQNCAQVAAEAIWLRYLVPDVKASCERAIKDEGHVFSNALRGTLPKVMFVVLPLVAGITGLLTVVGWQTERAAEWLDPVLYVWSACYLFIANRRVYRAGVLRAGFSVVTIAVAYAVFWAVGVAVAALYEFARA